MGATLGKHVERRLRAENEQVAARGVLDSGEFFPEMRKAAAAGKQHTSDESEIAVEGDLDTVEGDLDGKHEKSDADVGPDLAQGLSLQHPIKIIVKGPFHRLKQLNDAMCCHEAPATNSPILGQEQRKRNARCSATGAEVAAITGPREIIADIREWPHPKVLSKLKEHLDFSGPEWTTLYLSLDGAQLLHDVLATHLESASQDHEKAHAGVLATLECIHSLLNIRSGLTTVTEDQGFVRQLCGMFGCDDIDALKLLLDMISRICIFFPGGQEAILRGVLRDWAIPATLLQCSHTSAGSAQAHRRDKSFQPASSAPPPLPFPYGNQTKSLPAATYAPQAAPPPPPPPLPAHLPARAGKSARAPAPPPPPMPPSHLKKAQRAKPPPPPPPPPAHLKKTIQNGGPSSAVPPFHPSKAMQAEVPPPPPPPTHLRKAKQNGGHPVPAPPTHPSKAMQAAPLPPPPPPPTHLRKAKQNGDHPAPPPPTGPSKAMQAVPPPPPPPPPTHLKKAKQNGDHPMPAPPRHASEAKGAEMCPPPPPPPPTHLKTTKRNGVPSAPTPNTHPSKAKQTSNLPSVPFQPLAQGTRKQGGGLPPPPLPPFSLHPKKRKDAGTGGGNTETPAPLPRGDSAAASKPTSDETEAQPPAPANAMQGMGISSGEGTKLPVVVQKEQSQSLSVIVAADSVKQFVELFRVTEANSYDHDLLVSALLLLHALLEGHGEASPNQNLQEVFAIQLKTAGLLEFLSDMLDFGDAYVRRRAQQCQVMIQNVLPLEPQSPTLQETGKQKAPAPPPPPPPPPKPRLPAAPRAPAYVPPRVPPGPQPSLKVKNFFWDKIPDNRISDTFWDGHPPSGWLDWNGLEKLFQAPQRSKKLKAKAENSGHKKLAVLELKRATGIGIRMARLPVPWCSVREAILTCDDSVLRSADDVETILACVPNEEEIRMLESFLQSGGTMEDLSEAEMFALDLARVPRCETRLRTFQLKFTALETLQEAKEILQGHAAAAAELQSSKCFAEVLQVTLGAGNFLNWGTARGQAAGFRLRGLNKLQDTRSLDGQTSLLGYLADAVFECSASKSVLLTDELPNVTGTALKIPLSEVSEMLEMVTSAMHDCHHELRLTPPHVFAHLNVCEEAAQDAGEGKGGADSKAVRVRLLTDSYNEIMTEVCEAVLEQQGELQSAYAMTREAFGEVVEFFGDNVSSLANEADFWNDIVTFVTLFSNAQRERLKAQQAEEERLWRKLQKKKRKEPIPSTTVLPGNVPPSPCNKANEGTMYHSDLEAANNLEGNKVLDEVCCQAYCHGPVPAPPPDVSSVLTPPEADGIGPCGQQTESVVDRNPTTSSSSGNGWDQCGWAELVVSGAETPGKTSNADNHHNKSILVDTSLACLPLSSFRTRLEDGVTPAPRRRPAPLSERPVNYGSKDFARLKADLEEDLPLLPPVATPPHLHLLDDPEAAESPSVPPDTVYEQSKTPIPRIMSRFAHFKEPDPRASAVLWATADCNPAFGIARTPSGFSECDDISVGSLVFSASPCTEQDHSSMFGSGIECLNRSVTSISPMHGPNHDCEKCRRSWEEELSRASEGSEKKISLAAGIRHSNQSIAESSDAWRTNLSARDHDDVTLCVARSSVCHADSIFGADAQASFLNQSSRIPRPSMRLRASLRAGIDAAEAQGALPPGPEAVTKELDRQMDPRAPGMSLLASLGLVQSKEFPDS